jgi:hypothetical protein
VTTGNNVTNSNLFAGLRFLSVGYNGYAKITNTTVNNTASIIGILGASYKTADETIIDIDNCVFSEQKTRRKKHLMHAKEKDAPHTFHFFIDKIKPTLKAKNL